MRSILGLSSAAIVTVLLATTAGPRLAAAGPDDCSISGMQGSFSCPLSTWTAPPAGAQQQAVTTPSAAPRQQAGASMGGCTPHYELYSSHVKWVNVCPNLSQAPETAPVAH
jgi:hypothetical protein